MEGKKRKYKLFSSTDDRPSHLKPCAFFFSDVGCRNGANCIFSHNKDSLLPPPGTDTSIGQNGNSSAASQPEEVNSKVPPKDIVGTYAAEQSLNNRKAEKKAKKAMRRSRDTAVEHENGNGSTTSDSALPPAPHSSSSTSSKEDHEKVLMAAQLEELKAQMAAQQQQFEALQQAASQPVESNKPKSAKKVKVREEQTDFTRPPANFLSPVQHIMPATPYTQIGNLSMSSVSATARKRDRKKEEDDDHSMLFSAVNSVLMDDREKIGTTSVKKTRFTSSNANMIGSSNGWTINGPTNDDSDSDTNNKKNKNGVPMSALKSPSADENDSNKSSGNSSDNDNDDADDGDSDDSDDSDEDADTSSPASSSVGALLKQIKTSKSPFLDTAAVLKTLSTSGIEHGMGSKKGSVGEVAKSGNKKLLKMIDDADHMTLPWGELLHKCKTNPKYIKEYDFTQMMDSSWVKANSYGKWCKDLPAVVAIDCEMCQCIDPVTRKKDHNVLIRLSVVNGLNPKEVLLDKLVAPSAPISESRAYIHGITEDQLSGISYSLRQAQADFLRIVSDHTIIVGHSVHNDLKALKMSHDNCIDTSYLYEVENEPGAAPSMRDVCEHILGTKLKDIHDSVEDAQGALKAALFLLVQGVAGKSTPVIPRLSGNSTASNISSTFLAHRLPAHCTRDDLYKLIIKYTKIIPDEISDVSGPVATGKVRKPSGRGKARITVTERDDDQAVGRATITFSSEKHALFAFEQIPGPNRPDKSGRAQKRVYLKAAKKNKNTPKNATGGYICIRKN